MTRWLLQSWVMKGEEAAKSPRLGASARHKSNHALKSSLGGQTVRHISFGAGLIVGVISTIIVDFFWDIDWAHVAPIVSDLAPIATLLAAILAALIGLQTLRHRAKADRQDQWWKRAQWAIDLSLSDDDHRRTTGLAGINHLAESELAGAGESLFIDAVISSEVESIPKIQVPDTPGAELSKGEG